MNVKDIMARDVSSCSAAASAESVALAMWDHDCGCIPVCDACGRPTGIITDRDIAVTAALQHRPLCHIQARAIVGDRRLVVCREGDGVAAALDAMRRHRVRRLPVVDSDGRLSGMLSLGDVFAVASAGPGDEPAVDAIFEVMRAVSSHHAGARRFPLDVT